MLTVVGVALISSGRVLAARRTSPLQAAGRWELPGGKVLAGETIQAAAGREIDEELGCQVEVEAELAGEAPLDGGARLRVVRARLVAGEPVPIEHDAVRWLGREDLPDVDWLDADRRFLPALGALLAEGERLEGGNIAGAVRIGPTVRRTTGPWTPAVHALLDHLAQTGLDAVPRVLGVDDLGREVLTYLPGRVADIGAEPPEPLLVDAMRWLRRFHQAVAGFQHPGPWRFFDPAGSPGDIVCHHDFAPYNVSVGSSPTGDRVVGVFDWDVAGPGTPVQDLAFAAWNWVPLWRELPDAVAASRLRLMAEAYGDTVGASEILAAVAPRIEGLIAGIRAGQAAGEPGMVNLARIGEPAMSEGALASLRARLPRLDTLLRRH